MKVCIDKKYLVLPLGFHAVKKKLKFFVNKELVFDIDAAVDKNEPDYFQYLNMERFYGCEMDIQCDPQFEINFNITDELPNINLYHEKYRPQIHFSAKRGWINDPNGLLYYQGAYHMFYQYNPAGSKWGNMHWGHAVSHDLLHWDEKECALYPDESGTMFSGSAIIDIENRSGLKKNENDVIMLYYTAAGSTSLLSDGKKFTQCLAYSTDGGKTFQKYSGNPIVSHIECENRDPKVIFCPELQEYIMALYLNDNRYALLTSKNLLKWEFMQEIVLAGDSECPDFYPLALDGDKKNIKWILSGASDRYLVGDIQKGLFRANQPSKRLHYGKNSYAAQTFSEIPGEDGRRIRIAWNTMEVPNTYFNNSMCFPTEMKLKTIDSDLYLCVNPITEIQKLHVNTNTHSDINITEKDPFSTLLTGKTHDIEIQLKADENCEFVITFLGMEIYCKVKENLLRIHESTMPLYTNNGEVRLRLLVDTLGLEVFADQGQAHMCMGFLCDYNINNLKVKALNNSIILKKCTVSELKNIWS